MLRVKGVVTRLIGTNEVTGFMMRQFADIWKRIVRVDTAPTRTVQANDFKWKQSLVADLSRFANGMDFIVDSAEVDPGPRRFSDASAAVNSHRQVEFVALFDDGSWWAVTEEEYEYYIYVSEWTLPGRPDK